MEEIKKIIPGITQEQLSALSQLIEREYEKGKKEAENGFAQSQKEEKIDEVISAAGAKNVKAVKALLDMDAIAQDQNSLEKQLKDIKKECPYMFETDEKKPQFTSGKTKNGSVDKKMFDNMSYRKRLKLFSENPELYKQLVN